MWQPNAKRGPGRPFKKGQSGNPTGLPKSDKPTVERQLVKNLQAYAQQYTVEAIDNILFVMRHPKAPPACIISAASEILDRGWGKAKQAVDHTVHTTLEDLVMEAYRLRGEREKRVEPPIIEAKAEREPE
jgi:hypothetical protein